MTSEDRWQGMRLLGVGAAGIVAVIGGLALWLNFDRSDPEIVLPTRYIDASKEEGPRVGGFGFGRLSVPEPGKDSGSITPPQAAGPNDPPKPEPTKDAPAEPAKEAPKEPAKPAEPTTKPPASPA
jgi:outer membrane biosynthesis protein TonB